MATPARKRLPVRPSEAHLKKQAKRRAKADAVGLAQAQHRLAVEYGARDWAGLMHVVETMNRGADQFVNVQYDMEALPKAANAGDVDRVAAVLASGEFTQHDLDLALARSLFRFNEKPQIARLLLDHGADPDGQYGSGYGPIVFGTGEGLAAEALAFLIDAGADVTFAPIDTKYGSQCVLSYWLGTYVRGRNEAKHRGIELLLKHGAFVPPEVTPAVLAIHRGHAKELAGLVDRDRSLLTRRFADMPYGNIELRGATLLHAAVEFGEIECVDVLLDRHADINARADVIDGVGGQTPVFHAINTNCDGNFFVLERLARRAGPWIDTSVRATWRGGAGWAIQNFDPARTPLTPLEYAEAAARDVDPKHAHHRKHVDAELILLRSLDRRHAIGQRCRDGDVAAVTRLLDASPDLLTPELWPPAIFQARSLPLTRLLLDRGLDPDVCSAPRKPLHLAVDRGLIDVVRLLLSRGADVGVLDGENLTPYDLLCTGLATPDNAAELRAVLREAGAAETVFTHLYLGDDEAALATLAADPAIRDAIGPFHFSPLQTAARTASVRVVDALLAAGVAVDGPAGARNTPLWLACQSGRPADARLAVAARLLDAGAHINRANEEGATALHSAAWRGPLAIVELLLRRGAREWIGDQAGKLPRDHAAGGVAADKEAIVETLTRPVIRDPNFKAAVAAVHAGDVPTLRRLLTDHPNLATDRAVEPACYPPGYFGSPKLLWFVADNPTLVQTMPANVVAIADVIIDAGVDPDDLSYTLGLVMTSDPAKAQGLQRPLMKRLLERGASATRSDLLGTLGHGQTDAIRALLEGGLPLTAPIAAGLGRVDALAALLAGADAETVHDALSMAVINGQTDAARLCLDAGVDVNRPLRVHTHSTPLHHAAGNGQAELVSLLLDRGADRSTRDTLWNATPRQWAEHGKHSGIAAML